MISDFPNGMKNDIISSSVLKLDHEFFYMIGVSEYLAKYIYEWNKTSQIVIRKWLLKQSSQ